MLNVNLGSINNVKVNKIYDLDSYIQECKSKELVDFLEILQNSKKGISISIRADEQNTRVIVTIKSKYFMIDFIKGKFHQACIVNKKIYDNMPDAIEALKLLVIEHNKYIEENKKRIKENAIPGMKYTFEEIAYLNKDSLKYAV